MTAVRTAAILLTLLTLAGCGGADHSGAARERRTQRQVTAQLGPLVRDTARALVPSARLERDGSPNIVPCEDEGPVETISVSTTSVIANAAAGSAESFLAPARSFLTAHGFRLLYDEMGGLAMKRNGYVVEIASSPSGRPSITAATPCVRPSDPAHPLGL